MSQSEAIATMIKIEQLALFGSAFGKSSKEVSTFFDAYSVWQFIDDAYEGLHVQGAQASFQDINSYLTNLGAKL